jgi:hypothetical protein
MSENIFADEWHECLQAHYMHVVRTNDRVTLPSLTVVMHQAGFSESELAELRVRATMHVDKVDANFVPDLDILESAGQEEEAQREDARSEQDAPVFAVPDMPEESAVEFVPPEDEDEADLEDGIDPVPDDIPEDDPDAPEQLSLF